MFTQRAALAALAHRKEITPRIVAHFKQCRDTLVPLLAQVPGVQVASARGGMYAFFRIEGFDDSMAVLSGWWPRRSWPGPRRCVWPGRAGLAARCFASKDVNRLAEGVRRLQQWLESNRAA